MKIFSLFILFLFLSLQFFSQGYLRIDGGKVVSGSSGYIVSNNCQWVNNNSTTNLTLTNNTAKFIGNTTTYIGGSQPTPFYNLRIAKTSADVYLNQHQQVANQIYMESGDLDLRNYNITLSASASLANETYDKRIKATNGSNEGYGTGYITTTRTNPSGNVANLGLNFTPAGNLGNTEIRRGHLRLAGSGSFTSNYSVYRYYRIIPTTMQTLTINNFNYFVDGANPSAGVAELNVHPEANLQMFQEVQYGTPVYWQPRSTSVFPTSDYVTSTTVHPGLLNYILITLASTTVPLPVEYLTFYGNCNQNHVHLLWQTASETNNIGFYLEKSNDTQNWTTFLFVEGNGTTNAIHSYTATDNDPYTTNYYRIRQIDIDGTTSYSNIIAVDCSTNDWVEDILPIQPNNESQNFIVRGEPNKTYQLIFTNLLGQELLSKQIHLTSSEEIINLYENVFSTGMYYVTMLGTNKRITKPFVFNRQ